MSELKVFCFDVPVSGRETFCIVATSFEEALAKIEKADYYVEPETCEIDWDFGLGQDSSQHLPQCYTLSKFEE